MNQAPIDQEEPQNLRFLRRLVTVLTATMILGLLSIVALLVIRFWSPAPQVAFPDHIELPEGVTARTFTKGETWYAIVTKDDQILIFDAASGELTKTIQID